MYKRIYDEACGDIDTFFVKANELPGVKGEIVQSGSVYRLIFTECTCRLHKEGYVGTPLLCGVLAKVSYMRCRCFGPSENSA